MGLLGNLILVATFMQNSATRKLVHKRNLICKFIQSSSELHIASLELKSHTRWTIIPVSRKPIRSSIPCIKNKQNNKISSFSPPLHGSLLFYCCTRRYKWASVILITIMLHSRLYKVENPGLQNKQALWEKRCINARSLSSSFNAAWLRFCSNLDLGE